MTLPAGLPCQWGSSTASAGNLKLHCEKRPHHVGQSTVTRAGQLPGPRAGPSGSLRRFVLLSATWIKAHSNFGSIGCLSVRVDCRVLGLLSRLWPSRRFCPMALRRFQWPIGRALRLATGSAVLRLLGLPWAPAPAHAFLRACIGASPRPVVEPRVAACRPTKCGKTSGANPRAACSVCLAALGPSGHLR